MPRRTHARALAEALEVTSFRRPAPPRGPAAPAQRVGLRVRRRRSPRPGSRRSGRRASASRPRSACATGRPRPPRRPVALARGCRASTCHITVDFEHGFSDGPGRGGRATSAQLGAVAGVNLEDQPRRPRPPRRGDRRRQGPAPRPASSTRAPTRTGSRDGELEDALALPAYMPRPAPTGCSCPACRSRTSTRSRTRSTRRSTSSTSPGRPWRSWPRAARADQHGLDAVPGGAADGRRRGGRTSGRRRSGPRATPELRGCRQPGGG